MRVGLITSVSVHAILLLWGVLTFPEASPFKTDPVDSLPVELVSVAELTRLREGNSEAPDREVPVPRQIETRPEPEPIKPDEPVGVNETVLEAPPAEAPGQVAAPPQPSAEPAPPPAAEADPAPRAEPQPATPEPAPQAEPAPAPARVAATPRTKPAPPKPTVTAARQEPEDALSALINKQQAAGGGTQRPTEQASLGVRRGNDNAQLSQNDLDGLRQQISGCWNPPVGAIEAEDLKVLIQFKLKRDGTVDGPPRTVNRSSHPMFRTAADSARRAVLRCQPYSLPADKYDAWQDVKVTFDPREMFGG